MRGICRASQMCGVTCGCVCTARYQGRKERQEISSRSFGEEPLHKVNSEVNAKHVVIVLCETANLDDEFRCKFKGNVRFKPIKALI